MKTNIHRNEVLLSYLSNDNSYYTLYDNIGNRKAAQKLAEESTYESNQPNQYREITQGETPFTPTFDADGNQTLIKTTTGIWTVAYNADNRPTSFTQAQGDQSTIIECDYDYIGRRYTKKVTNNGTVSLHQRYIYRGYLQIACVDLTRSEHPALWYITWDPTEPVATRPLAIQKNATWYTYSHDLTKNVTELYQSDGLIATTYDYSPYGAATAEGIDQPLQWSSEYHDSALALSYYNYRHYNPTDGRWINRDPIEEQGGFSLYGFVQNNPIFKMDYLGKEDPKKCACFHFISITALRYTNSDPIKIAGKKFAKEAAKALVMELLEDIVKKTASVTSVLGIYADIAQDMARCIDIVYAYKCVKLDSGWTVEVKTVESGFAIVKNGCFGKSQLAQARQAIGVAMRDIQKNIKEICQCEE